MKARTLGLVLIAVALLAAFFGQWRASADPPAPPVPSARTAGR
jgi:hypothetical protein